MKKLTPEILSLMEDVAAAKTKEQYASVRARFEAMQKKDSSLGEMFANALLRAGQRTGAIDL